MKYIILILYGIILLRKAKCHVTRNVDFTHVTKSTLDSSTESLKDGDILRNSELESKFLAAKTQVSSGKLRPTKTVPVEPTRVYLEDVVYALKNHEWKDEELPCLNQTLRLLRGLQNFTLWAVWDWDSISSQPQGLLYGNQYELGNFDECMNTPWGTKHEELQTQYCLAEIVLERTDKSVRYVDRPVQPYQSALDFIQFRSSYSRPLNELTWGACIPAVCPPRAVERLMATMLARSHLGTAGMRPRITVAEPCQRSDRPRQFDGLFWSFVIFTGVLLLVCSFSTYLNCKQDLDDQTTKSQIIKAFCLKENGKDLLNMKKEGVEVLYGIRFLTICFIVMDHQLGIFNAGPIGNGSKVDHDILSYMALFVLHDDLFVDTFFLLSGLLGAIAFKQFKNFPNPIIFILKRYVRLVVAFAIVIYFYCAVFPYIGSGPLWNRAIAGETDPCRKNWWLSLLMLNNYVDSENICIVVSWYIPCDFHFFVLAVVLYWVYSRCPKLGGTCAILLAIGGVVAPGVITYVKRMPAVQLFTYEFVRDPRASEQFHATYIKSHTRFAAYAVGFTTGFIFATIKDSGNLKRISKKWSILGALAGMTLMTAVMCVGATYLWRDYDELEGAVYAALNRPLWACGVAMLILCCSCGCVPYVEKVLTWYPFVPLSRLSYGLYLTHTMLITRNVFVSRSPQYHDYLNLLTSAGGVLVLGLMMALLIWLLAEAPANNLLVLFLKKLFKKKIKKEMSSIDQSKSISTIDSASAMPSGSSGHLHSNLPTSVPAEFNTKIYL